MEQDMASGAYDIYRDPNVAEVVRLDPVLSSMRTRIEQLLEQWPEHPALLRVCEMKHVCTRFSIQPQFHNFNFVVSSFTDYRND